MPAAVDGKVQAAVISHVVWPVFIFSAVYGEIHLVGGYDYVALVRPVVYWYLCGWRIELISVVGVYGVEVYGVSQVGSYLSYPSIRWA